MLKSFLIYLTLSFFFLFSFSPLFCANIRHDPDHIFLKISPDQSLAIPQRATKADLLHTKNIKGRGVKVAIIDIGIHPNDVHELAKTRCILPASLQKKLVLTPNERFEKRKDALRKQYLDKINQDQTKKSIHGSLVMRAFHLIAPEAQVLPIDLNCISIHESHGGLRIPNGHHCASLAIQEAIKQNVDVISLSNYIADPPSAPQEFVDALQKAAKKGIAIICGAGNESTKSTPVYLDTGKNPTSALFYKRDDKKAFEKLNGRGMLYVGSVGYTKTGEERFSDFSHHPKQDTQRKYLLGPGEGVVLESNNELLWGSGTSYSTPYASGGFALLKQYATNKGLAHTAEDLLGILHQSGHDLTHDIPGTLFKSYKVLNLHNAMQHVDSAVKNIKQIVNAPKEELAVKKSSHQKVKKPARKKHLTISKRRAAAKKASHRKAKRRAIIRKYSTSHRQKARVNRKSTLHQKRKRVKRAKRQKRK